VLRGPYEELAPYREFMGYTHKWYSTADVDDPTFPDEALVCLVHRGDRVFLTYQTDGRGVEVMMPALKLLDLTAYGRQEDWEDSPQGWPQDPSQSWFHARRPPDPAVDPSGRDTHCRPHRFQTAAWPNPEHGCAQIRDPLRDPSGNRWRWPANTVSGWPDGWRLSV